MPLPVTRRRLLALSAGTIGASFLHSAGGFGQTARLEGKTMRLYIGCDTNIAGAKGVAVAQFDPATGKISTPVFAAAAPRAAFFAFGAAHEGGARVLHVCEEGSDVEHSKISSWKISEPAGALTLLTRVSAGFAGPAHFTLDRTQRCAFSASYAGSGIASYQVLPNGGLSEPVERVDFRDAKFGHVGPHLPQQNASHPHSTIVSPDNRYLFVNDLGNDRINVFAIDPATAKLTFLPEASWTGRPGSGPRHIAIHPNGRWIYNICELDAKLDHLQWTAGKTPTLKAIGAPVDTLADGYAGPPNSAAEVELSPDGRFLYTSNRGENTLVVFAIDPATGAPLFLQRITCGGNGPRQFKLSPDAGALVCGNQLNGLVTTYLRDAATGLLTGPVQALEVMAPMVVLFG